ncbi:MAG: metallophosphoesterase family protein [Desulfofustis sp.]|nr:metallophosphoesterase family protein [Desulfofustis sp.]
MIQKVGILSDTHRSCGDPAFTRAVRSAFQDCQLIAHAGDLTDMRILNAFSDKQVYAVHGNMCNAATRDLLPESLTFSVGNYLLSLCHSHRAGHDREEDLLNRFAEADCIIFGHTHQAVIRRVGSILLINPGSFRSTGRYGSHGTYAILTIAESGLSAEIVQLSLPL